MAWSNALHVSAPTTTIQQNIVACFGHVIFVSQTCTILQIFWLPLINVLLSTFIDNRSFMKIPSDRHSSEISFKKIDSISSLVICHWCGLFFVFYHRCSQQTCDPHGVKVWSFTSNLMVDMCKDMDAGISQKKRTGYNHNKRCALAEKYPIC